MAIPARTRLRRPDDARRMVGVLAASVAMLLAQCLALPAQAENPMGYRLLSPEEAAGLPHGGGALGLSVARASRIDDGGMMFELMQVRSVRPGSAGAQAGLRVGDQIIALDGRVFPSVALFARYVGAMPPGREVGVDFMPAGGGPQQAQRVLVTFGDAAQPSQPSDPGQVAPHGMSTGAKVAIGAGAVALLGCYEVGCFSHRKATTTPQPAAGR